MAVRVLGDVLFPPTLGPKTFLVHDPDDHKPPAFILVGDRTRAGRYEIFFIEIDLARLEQDLASYIVPEISTVIAPPPEFLIAFKIAVVRQ